MSAEQKSGADLFSRPGWEDSQCARCGSSVIAVDCERCGNEGWLLDDDGATIERCPEDCIGERCSSDAEWCNTNPLPGREHVKRGEIEDFIVRRSA